MLRKILLMVILSFSTNAYSKTENNQNIPSYKAKDFSYLLKTSSFDQDLLTMHFKLYEGYVKNTNALLNMLKKLEHNNQMGSYEYQALKRRFGWEFDGMRLHELYFGNLKKADENIQQLEIVKAIISQYASFDAWKKDFIATGMIRGIGWSILYLDMETGRLVNVWINEHNVNHLVKGSPILVMDVWEHAYMPEFNLDRRKYIEVFFENINWQEVEKRFKASNSQK